VAGPLIERLFERLDEVITTNEKRTHEESYLQRLVAWHIKANTPLPPIVRERHIVRAVNGRPMTLDECFEATSSSKRPHGRALLRAAKVSSLTDALEANGIVVVSSGRASSALLKALSRGEPSILARRAYCIPARPVEIRDGIAWEALRSTTLSLLQKAGTKVSDLTLGHFDFQGSGIKGWPAMTQRRVGEVTPRDEARSLGRSLLARKRVLVVNADHPTVTQLMALAPKEPELAAYTLAKLFFLGHQLDTKLDSELATIAAERRCRRLKS
jgi:hypothetical protein